MTDIRSTSLSDEQTKALAAAVESLDATLIVVVRIIRETEELEVAAHGLLGLSPATRRALLTVVSESLARGAESLARGADTQ